MESKRSITSVVLHSEQMNAILATFNDEQLGIIIRAFFEWCFTGKEYDGKDGMIKFAFLTLKTQAKHDFAKYDVIVERRREAGKKGGLKRAENSKQTQANQANGSKSSKCYQNQANQANQADNVNDNDNINDNVNDNDNVNINVNIHSKECVSNIERTPTLSNPTLEQVLEYAKNMQLDEEDAKKYFYHYDAQGWITGQGAKVKNWQSKLQSWCFENSQRRPTNGRTRKQQEDDEYFDNLIKQHELQEKIKQQEQWNK